MDEFEDMMAEMDESVRKVVDELKAIRHFDKKVLNAFKNDVEELTDIKNEYANKLSELRSLAQKEVVKFEYSKGGETIHRGYYCPSPVFDLIVGGAKRGKLYKRKPSFGKYSYEYGFDKNGRLMRVKDVNEFTTPDSCFDEEYLLYGDNVVYGLEFDHMNELRVVSKCMYDHGNIVQYQRSVGGNEKYDDLHCEKYLYENGLLSEVTIFFNAIPSMGIYEENRYTVEQDGDGNIIRLTGGEIVNGEWHKEVQYSLTRK
jgi:hypothetical protein